jgi:hypothetical protein
MESDDVPFSDVTNTEPCMIPAECFRSLGLISTEDGQQCGCAHRFSVAGLRQTLALSPDSKAYRTDWANSLNLLDFGMKIVPRAEREILAAKLEAAASAKREQIAGVRIALERLLHLQRKTVHAASHVGSRPPQSKTERRMGQYHRRARAFKDPPAPPYQRLSRHHPLALRKDNLHLATRSVMTSPALLSGPITGRIGANSFVATRSTPS